MTSKVDMSLDDIIVKNKISFRGNRRGQGRGIRGAATGRGRARGRGRGAGIATRGRGGFVGTRGRGRAGIFRGSRGGSSINGRWSHDMYYGGASTLRAPVSLGPTKLSITNLDYGVSDSDIKELFSEFGNMRSASVHYDRTGRSLGTAHVVFERRADAQKAIKQYNGVHLDGRPMNIEIEGMSGVASNIRGRGSGSIMNGVRGRGISRGVKRLQGLPRPIGVAGRGRGTRGRGVIRGARGRGRGGRRGRGSPRKIPTAEDLDAELDEYTRNFQNSK